MPRDLHFGGLEPTHIHTYITYLLIFYAFLCDGGRPQRSSLTQREGLSQRRRSLAIPTTRVPAATGNTASRSVSTPPSSHRFEAVWLGAHCVRHKKGMAKPSWRCNRDPYTRYIGTAETLGWARRISAWSAHPAAKGGRSHFLPLTPADGPHPRPSV